MEIDEFLKNTYETSGLDQEKEILNAIKGNKKFKDIYEKGLEGSFFSLNEDKMHALIKATTNDMTKAEHAMLRMANDQYQKFIFKTQVMSNSGTFTLQQSIDAATKDFLKAGINCIQYKNGRRINIASYAEMCLRTSTKRAMLVSEGEVRNAYGVHSVRISKYGGCSETCLPWQGKVYVDDVWSGGTKEEAEEKKLPLLSEAIEGGLFHPNCKHRSTTYFYDLKKEQGKLQDDGIENPPEEQEHRKNQLHIQQQKRIETDSLDPRNIETSRQRKEQWIEKDKIVKKSVRFFYCFRSIIKITKGGISMCRNYEVKDITKTSRGISFLPKIKAEGAKTFEVVFSRLQAKKSLWIEIPVPMEMQNQVLDLFFVDIRGNLYQMETKKQSDCIGFYTNKVGFYILMARKQEKSTTLSKLRSSLYRV